MPSLLTTAGRALLLTTPWTGGAYKVALLGPGYTPSPSDGLVQAALHEVSGAGYAGGHGGSGRKALAGKTITVDAPGDRVLVGADDVTWTGLDAGVIAWAAVLQESGGSDALSTLVAVLRVPATASDGGDFTLRWPPTGLWTG